MPGAMLWISYPCSNLHIEKDWRTSRKPLRKLYESGPDRAVMDDGGSSIQGAKNEVNARRP